MSQVTDALISQVIEAHSECEKLASKTEEAMRAHLHAAWRAGNYLESLQKQCKREGRNYTSLFSNRGPESETNFTFTYETSRIYTRLFSAYPDGIKDLADHIHTVKDAMIAAGLIEKAERQPQNSNGMLSWFSRFITGVSSVCSILQKEVDKKPIEEWDRERCERIVEQGKQFTGFVSRAEARLNQLGSAA